MRDLQTKWRVAQTRGQVYRRSRWAEHATLLRSDWQRSWLYNLLVMEPNGWEMKLYHMGAG
jgi:hypothetical protein